MTTEMMDTWSPENDDSREPPFSLLDTKEMQTYTMQAVKRAKCHRLSWYACLSFSLCLSVCLSV